MLKEIAISFFLLFVLFANAQDKENEFGNVTVEELKEEFCSIDSMAHAAYLYKSQVLRCVQEMSGWYHETTVYEKIKIYDERGFDEAKKVISYYNSEKGSREKVSEIKAYTYVLENGEIKKIKLDKKEIFQEDDGKGWKAKKFTMPNLQKGVIVEWEYKISSPFVLYIDRLILQEAIPIKKYSGVLIIPEYFVFKLYKTGVLPIEISKISREMKVLKGKENLYLIETDSVPAFEEEAFMSNRKNFISSIDFDLSYVKFPGVSRKKYARDNWEEVAKIIFKTYDYNKNLKKKKYFEDDFLTLDLEGKSDKEKISVMLEHVKSKIKWNRSFKKGLSPDLGVKEAYQVGEGNAIDINLVLIAMLKRAGFKASPVMVSTREHGVSLFPSTKAYNYMIAAVEGIDEHPILLDATEKFSYLNVLPSRAINWFGRLVREDFTSKDIYLNPTVYVLKTHQLNVKIREDLSVQGVLKTTFTTQNALRYRGKVNNLSLEAHKDYIQEKYDVEVESLKTVFENNSGQPYTRLVGFSIEDAEAIETINEKLYIEPLFFLRSKTNPFKLEKRDYPVDFGYPWKNDYRIMIEIPEGYRVDYLPKDGSFDMRDHKGKYTYQMVQNGNLISVLFSVQVNSSAIAPEYYEDLKEFYRSNIAKQAEKIVLKKKE